MGVMTPLVTPDKDEALRLLFEAQDAYWTAEEEYIAACERRVDAIYLARCAGWLERDLMEHLGVTRSVISRAFKRARARHGIPHPFTPEEWNEVHA